MAAAACALLAAAAAAAPAPMAAPAGTAAPQKVLRYAFPIAETGFDPAKINDIYSRTLTAHIFEALYRYDHLARPVKLKPLTAQALPEHSADFRTWTVRLKPGIYFADDPAFKGAKRELVAEDYVYSFKRIADPATKSPTWSGLAEEKIVGLAAVRQAALDAGAPFDYAREVPGLRALDRYTIQFRLEQPRPRFVEGLAASDLRGAVAREVVAHYGDQIDAHPVGTGPFRLAQWRRSSFIVLERNPGYRDQPYDAEPAADDAEGQAIAARLKGRRLPLVDRVEVSIIEEQQPRWLSFVNGEADFADRVGDQFLGQAMPGGRLSPALARQGVQAFRRIETGSTVYFFNMEHATVGGYTPDKVALRRAIALGMSLDGEIRLLRYGQATPAQSPLVPFTSGYDPQWKSEFSDHDPARAKALLDLYGYVDRDGDGWREMPDGSPLVVHLASEPDQRSRQFNELTKKDMDAIGVRMVFDLSPWPENLKSARAGRLAMWHLGGSAAAPDGQGALARYDSREIGGQNLARFKLPAMDAVLDRLRVVEDGPEREALFVQAKKLSLAYMPYKFRVHRLLTDMAYPWVVGYRRPVFWLDWWQYVDIDGAELARRRAR